MEEMNYNFKIAHMTKSELIDEINVLITYNEKLKDTIELLNEELEDDCVGTAERVWRQFEALTDAGFSEAQAMQIIYLWNGWANKKNEE